METSRKMNGELLTCKVVRVSNIAIFETFRTPNL